jgi:hypothetical protein
MERNNSHNNMYYKVTRMFTKTQKWIAVTGSTVLFLLCLFGCINLLENIRPGNNPTGRSPVRTLSIEIEEDYREALFTQLRKFSGKNNLSFDLSFYTRETTNDSFFLDMHGVGLSISVASKPFDTRELEFYFIVDDPKNPPSEEVVNELYNDLINFIAEIPNVVIVKP